MLKIKPNVPLAFTDHLLFETDQSLIEWARQAQAQEGLTKVLFCNVTNHNVSEVHKVMCRLQQELGIECYVGTEEEEQTLNRYNDNSAFFQFWYGLNE